MVVYQDSLNNATKKYPEILQQLNQTVAEASSKPLTPASINSDSLDSCGDFTNSTAPEVQWMVMLGQTQKTVTYVPESVSFLIVNDGVNVSLQTVTNFTTPVWAGACAGGIVIANPNEYPQIKWAINNASTTLTSSLASGIPSTGNFPGCGVGYFVCGGDGGAPSFCQPPYVNVQPDEGSFQLHANPASPTNSYIATMNVHVDMKVQVGVQPCTKVWTFGCHCEVRNVPVCHTFYVSCPISPFFSCRFTLRCVLMILVHVSIPVDVCDTI